MPSESTLFGAIEAGGTKFNCAIGTADGEILHQTRIETRLPEETLAEVIAYFQSQPKIAALGIGSFGPLDLNPKSPTFGYITKTPKPHWSQTPLLPTLSAALKIPAAIDTDVNASALGEQRWGAGRGLDHVLYLTIGTGIGGGAVILGQPLHGLLHPEMGHLVLPTRPDAAPGVCPFHGSCLEGLISGPALTKRYGLPAEQLHESHPCWDEFAEILGSALANFAFTLSPHKIILGGGVMHQRHLLAKVQQQVELRLGSYLIPPPLEEWITHPALGDLSGLKGALILARSTLNR